MLLLLAICLLALYAPLKELKLSAYQPVQERLRPYLVWLAVAGLCALHSTAVGYWIALAATTKSAAPEQTPAAEPRYLRFIHASLILLFLLSILFSLRSFPHAIWGGDTDDYLYMAEKSIFNREFYAGPRPWTTALLYKLLGADRKIANFTDENDIIRGSASATRIVLAQVGIHALSWLALALLAASMIKTPWLRPLLMGIILMIGLSPQVYWWNRLLLSESLSISLLALLLACWLWLLKGWQWHKVFALCAVSLLWIFTRETNAYLVLGSAALLILYVLTLKRSNVRTFGRAAWLIALFYIALFALNSSLSDLRNRWATPLANVIFQRILPDEPARAYFIEHGMPVDAQILAMEGQWACSDNCALFKEQQYAAFVNWLTGEGRKVYMGYLLTHPFAALAAPLQNLDVLTGSGLSFADLPGYTPPLPTWLANVIYFQEFGALMFWLAILIAAALVFRRAWRANPALGLALALLLLAYPHVFLVYHGDAMGLSRHAIQFNVQVRLVFWLLMALAADFVLQRSSAK